MRFIPAILVCVSCISACQQTATQHPTAAPDNLAERWVHSQVPKADCVNYFNGVGVEFAYSTKCAMPNETTVYCWLDAGHQPQCACVSGPCQSPAKQEAAPPVAAASVSPSPASVPAPAPAATSVAPVKSPPKK